MTTELAIRTDDMDLMTLGKVLVQSGCFKETKDAAQAIVKVLAGRELGLGPIASMRGVSLVMGNITLNASLIASLIKSSKKYNYQVIEHTEERCELAFFENSKEVGRSSFSMDDAKKAGLADKDLWKKYPRNLVFARAMSNGAKWYCAEVFNGPVYTPDELDATDVVVPHIGTQSIQGTPKAALLPDKPLPTLPESAPDLRPQLSQDLKTLRGHARAMGIKAVPSIQSGGDATAQDLEACIEATRKLMLTRLDELQQWADTAEVALTALPTAPGRLSGVQIAYFAQEWEKALNEHAPDEQPAESEPVPA